MESLKENKMGVMPVGKLLFTMALPLALSMLVQALYNVVDSIFVSQISDENNFALTAVGLAFPIQNIMIAVSTGVAVGANALLSRSLGEKDQERVNQAARNGMFLMVIAIILTAVLGFFLAEPFMRSQSSNEAVVSYGITYIRITTVISFGIYGEILTERLLQATGRTVYTLFTQGVGAVLNIVLDPIFIFGWGPIPRMEVAGAAVATVIGQVVACILGIIFNVKKNKEISMSIKGFRPNGEIIRRILGIGVPSAIMIGIGSLMYYFFNLVLSRFEGVGEVGNTVFGAYYKLQSFIFMPIFGIGNTVLPIVAYNYGAKKPDRIMKTIKYAMLGASAIMLTGTLIFQIFPAQLLGFFNPDEAMLEVGVPALRIVSLPFVLAGICIVCSNVFQGLGKGVYSMLGSIARQIVILIPAAFLLSLAGNIDLVWISFPISEIVALVMSLFMLLSVYRKIIRPLYNSSCKENQNIV